MLGSICGGFAEAVRFFASSTRCGERVRAGGVAFLANRSPSLPTASNVVGWSLPRPRSSASTMRRRASQRRPDRPRAQRTAARLSTLISVLRCSPPSVRCSISIAASEQRLGSRKIALCMKEHAEIVVGGQRVEVLLAEGALLRFERAPIQGLGGGGVAALIEQVGHENSCSATSARARRPGRFRAIRASAGRAPLHPAAGPAAIGRAADYPRRCTTTRDPAGGRSSRATGDTIRWPSSGGSRRTPRRPARRARSAE